MPNFICVTCGVQHTETDSPPSIASFAKMTGSILVTRGNCGRPFQRCKRIITIELRKLNRIHRHSHDSEFRAIGQRALLVQTSKGNVLWDCPSLLDDATVEAIRLRGGIGVIAVSHPHLVGSLVDWSRAFDNAPIYWHADNREWVMRPDPAYVFWEGDTQPILDGLTLIRCGGHFPGSDVLHWPQGAEGRGVLLTGDTMQLAQDRRYVSFMYSYPNMIPLNARAVRGIVQAVEPFDLIASYGGWWEYIMPTDAKAAVKRSAERYIKAISL